jgi:biofilm PGA synthesis protein PgaA
MDLKRFGAADVQVNHLDYDAPRHPETRDLDTRWDWFNRYEYLAQVQVGQSDDSPVTGSGDITFDQWLYSKPIANHYRLFAHHQYDWADFDEGAGHTNRIGLGGDYRSDPFDLALSANQRSPGGEAGLAASGEYRFDDKLAVFADVQSDSDQIPLRAIRADEEVSGPSATVGVSYRWDEGRSARLAYSRIEIDDGEYRNGTPFMDDTRQSLSASYSHAIYNDAHQRIALTGDLYYSRNSADDSVPYFNPASDRAAQIGIDYTGILQRRFERVWSHRAIAGVGAYDQEGYGGAGIWSAQYEQRWQFGPGFGVNYGVLYRSRVYDGDREGYGAVFGGIQWRF